MRTHWLLVGLLFVVGLLAAAQFGKISLALGPLGDVYGRTDTQLALGVSLVGVVGILFGATAGVMVGGIGARRVILAALALGAGLSVFQAVFPPYPVFLATRVLEGVSHLALVVAAPTIMAAVSASRDQSVVMGIWGMFFGVSFALMAVALSILLPVIGLNGLYLAHGSLMATLCVLLWPLLPRGMAAQSAQGWIDVHREIYSKVRIAAPALCFLWHTLIFVALLTFMAPALDAPWLAPLLPLIALLGTFGAGVAARWRAPDVVARIGFFGSIMFAVALLLTDALWTVFPFFFFVGIVPGASFAAIPYLNKTSADQAGANGALAQLGNVGTASGTPIFALALSGAGVNGLLWLTIVLSGLGFLVVWITAVLIQRQEV
jgi:predicted MFS family arabinose efflux permease